MRNFAVTWLLDLAGRFGDDELTVDLAKCLIRWRSRAVPERGET